LTIALVSGATATLRRYARTGSFGQLIVPGAGNVPDLGLPWACDNGAFSGFDEARFTAMLERLLPFQRERPCMWVACPDVVGDAAATLDLFARWAPEVGALDYPTALVAQDGLESAEVPWAMVDCLFVGGTTAWKLSAEARALLAEARSRQMLTHVGRVNSARRARYCCALGVDSIDGTTLSAWPDRWFPHFATILANPQTGLEIA
jgi:hypothetical protein